MDNQRYPTDNTTDATYPDYDPAANCGMTASSDANSTAGPMSDCLYDDMGLYTNFSSFAPSAGAHNHDFQLPSSMCENPQTGQQTFLAAPWAGDLGFTTAGFDPIGGGLESSTLQYGEKPYGLGLWSNMGGSEAWPLNQRYAFNDPPSEPISSGSTTTTHFFPQQDGFSDFPSPMSSTFPQSATSETFPSFPPAPTYGLMEDMPLGRPPGSIDFFEQQQADHHSLDALSQSNRPVHTSRSQSRQLPQLALPQRGTMFPNLSGFESTQPYPIDSSNDPLGVSISSSTALNRMSNVEVQDGVYAEDQDIGRILAQLAAESMEPLHESSSSLQPSGEHQIPPRASSRGLAQAGMHQSIATAGGAGIQKPTARSGSRGRQVRARPAASRAKGAPVKPCAAPGTLDNVGGDCQSEPAVHPAEHAATAVTSPSQACDSVPTSSPASNRDPHLVCSSLKDDGQACLRRFKKREHLRRHEAAHSKEKPYRCELCGKRMGRSDNMRQHKRTHNNPLGRNTKQLLAKQELARQEL